MKKEEMIKKLSDAKDLLSQIVNEDLDKQPYLELQDKDIEFMNIFANLNVVLKELEEVTNDLVINEKIKALEVAYFIQSNLTDVQKVQDLVTLLEMKSYGVPNETIHNLSFFASSPHQVKEYVSKIISILES